MKWSQLLDYINNYLEKLSTFQKIELYLIPVITGFLLLYNFPRLQKNNSLNHENNKDINFYTIKKEQLIEKLNDVHTIKTAKDLELFAKENRLNISTLKVLPKEITLEVEGEIKNILYFIDFCENYNSSSKINNLMISKSKENIKAFLTISFSQIIKTNNNFEVKNKIQKIKDPFTLNISKPYPKLYAIVNDYVLINNKWLKQGDVFDGYEVLKIHLDYVELKSDLNVFKIGLFGEK